MDRPTFKRSGPESHWSKAMKGVLAPAFAELDRSRDVMINNAKIAEQEGRDEDARGERFNAHSFQTAIDRLNLST